MSNFDFLQPDWPEFSGDAKAVEKLVRFDPRGACGRARHLIEQVVLWMYEHDEDLEMPYETNFHTLINEISFKKIIGPQVYFKIDAIRKMGNIALHEKKRISEQDAMQICRETFHVMYWLYRTYTTDEQPKPEIKFDAGKVPVTEKEPQVSPEDLEKLQQQMEERAEELRVLQESLLEKDEELAQRNREIKQMRLQTRKFADNHDYNEAETRELLIDVMLRESGWDPAAPRVREYKVKGMPNSSGVGYVDYVLWDDDGKPLALVEAKRTTRSVEQGQHQAKLYADCLEAQFDVRPVIFLSNGYQIWIWDDTEYPPRDVLGFYTKASLQTLFFQRREKQSLHLAEIDKKISGRYYQIEAIRRVGERFQKGHRRALLVMATGTGKTRTAVSLTDVLLKNKWAKRVLFLADRNALVRQAYKAYAEHLPEVPIVNLVDEKNDTAARVVFSTYPTMLNQIEKLEEGQRKFDPGYFDLVIIDEAHRSIYNKYDAIFSYFDSLLLGLTATPKDDVDHDTYNKFNAEQGNPTFAYGLEQAVKDGYLVPPKKVSVLGKFLTEGIKYNDLSEEEKLEYDDLLADDETGVAPDHIDPAKLNSWLFNRDTVEKVLHQLMEQGIKVEGGDRLGDTIIFAKNHKHAVFIQKVFDENYPHYAGNFARVIDNQVEQAQDLIDKFCSPGKLPAIAISVDMLDTGIDAPDVVNLVFFKPVKSKAKFNQMIGRGTRLREELFGPARHKQHFLILDFCGNFEFFDENPEGYDVQTSPSISASIFEKRLLLTAKLKNEPWNRDEDLRVYRESLLDLLHQQIANLERQSVQVRPYLKLVDKMSERSVWDHLESHERKEIVSNLAELIPVDINEDEKTRRFDLMILTLQHERLDGVLEERPTQNKLVDLADHLWSKKHIPAVKKVVQTLKDVLSEEYWGGVTVLDLEQIRKDLRGLMHLIDRSKRDPIYTNFQDEFTDVKEHGSTTAGDSAVDPERYKRRLKQFISENKNHLIIEKVRKAQPLTDKEVETLEKFLIEADPNINPDDFHEIVGEELELVRFIRAATGLKREAVIREFEEYLQEKRLSSNQIQFIQQMIEFYTKNGNLDVANLYEPPFNFINEDGLDGVFKDNIHLVDGIVNKVKKLNEVKIG
ncbi:DEAD/DEAH box helicase family protein [Rhodohalobacter halophilus]|uniref:DEAD/DEAH box helicase family protein n=1 Tax=Rhodohalobacter halophilus TaxID=1812810 RepID=UPI00083F6F1C|nr:DEAD/DEAH box helicase family protein [Rhodohalobacter halophilus]